MTAQRSFQMVHSILIRSEPSAVLELILNVENWPQVFPPCRHARVLSREADKMVIEITAQVGETTQTWQSERVIDAEQHTVHFRQMRSFSPIRSMTGCWRLHREPDVGCRAELIHDFVVEADEDRFATLDDAESWIRIACDNNSHSEMTALKQAAEVARMPIRDFLALTRPRLTYPEIRYDELLTRSAERSPDHVAIVYRDLPISLRCLDLLVNRIAHVLRADLQLVEHDVVALTAAARPEAIATFQAVSRIGAVVTPINPLHAARDIEYQLRDSEAVVAVVSAESYAAVCELQSRLPKLRRVVRYGAPSRDAKLEVELLALAEKHSSEPPPAPKVDLDALLALPYSSGTSGLPKGVMLSHRNLVSNALQFVVAHQVTGSDVLVNGLPVLISMHMGAALASGATHVLLDRWDARRLLELARRHAGTQLYTVTPMVAALHRLPDLERLRPDSLRLISCGASSLQPELSRSVAARLRVPVLQGYGLTEASPLTHATPFVADYLSPSGASGLPVPDTEQRVVDLATGLPVGSDQVGQLCIRGPQVMSGYWRAPQETERALRDGWLWTGDLVRLDADGYMHYVDRCKDVIKSQGHTIAPVELESALRAHPAVVDCAVVGCDTGYDEQKPYAFVLARPGTDPEAVRADVNSALTEYKQLWKVEIVEELPRGGAGKLLRRVLRERAQRSSSAESSVAVEAVPC